MQVKYGLKEASLKKLVKSIRDELEYERIKRDDLIQEASDVINDENTQLKYSNKLL